MKEKPVKTEYQRIAESLLVEVAWEVCNQVGGIYTVIRSKLPSIVKKWGDNYCLIGPNVHPNVSVEFEPTSDMEDVFGQAVKRMQERGLDVQYGRWLVTGRPKVVLVNPKSAMNCLSDIKRDLWDEHHIATGDGNELLDQVLAFGFLTQLFFEELADIEKGKERNTLAHFHEWMAGMPIPIMRQKELPIGIVFTTHATMLGRYLAMNDPGYYEHLPFLDWEKEGKHFGIMPIVQLERAAAHGAHVFTTVSEVTARECEIFLGRKPEVILPNGLNIKRFTALHEFQNLHQRFKQEIHQFVMANFFHSYSFDLDDTLYFFTSGRYEYRNKGFDLTLEALARLNWRMKQANMTKNVVMFFVTRKPYHTINPLVLQSRAEMEEVRRNCEAITAQMAKRLFYATSSQSSSSKLPDLNGLVDDYWKLRLRRSLQTWKSESLPPVVTHDLKNPEEDEILQFVRMANLMNQEDNRVKIVYHPDFISTTNPLFGMDYRDFVRGCHLGVFPSYYEPWGYTPLECIASGVPTITSDLAGFGDYILQTMQNPERKGIYVVNRLNKGFDEAANQLCEYLFSFVQYSRRDRIEQRNRVEASSVGFDWENLTKHYEMAYALAMVK